MSITIAVQINAPLETVWSCWTTPEDIIKWNTPSDDWHTPHATNNLKENGRFNYRMEAKDGNMGFNFEGTFTKIIPLSQIEYVLDDGRRVTITFSKIGNEIEIKETFEPETINDVELQRKGWLAILNNFKTYVEHNKQKQS